MDIPIFHFTRVDTVMASRLFSDSGSKKKLLSYMDIVSTFEMC